MISVLLLIIKSLDSIIEEMEDYENKDIKQPYDWIIREVIMQHRLKLHDEIGLLMKEQHKISQIVKSFPRITS
jgi:hypothetical protein